MSGPGDVLEAQRELWGTAPRDWAELAEPENLPLYERMLDLAAAGTDAAPGVDAARGTDAAAGTDAEIGAGAGPDPRGASLDGVTLLDLGCGSGLLCRLAADRGARVAGIDICPELLEVARERTPAADLREGDFSATPHADASFDVITAANALQFAPDPAAAFAEAARVLRPQGLLVVALFAEPERNEGTILHLAMKELVERVEGRQDGYAPYALSQPGGLEAAVRDAGLAVCEAGEVPVVWRYADRETTLRALLCSAGGARAAKVAGRGPVEAALTEAMTPLVGPDGSVTMRNTFRYVVARRPAVGAG